MSACKILEQFNGIMQETITVYVPQRLVSRLHKPLWMTTKVIRSVKKKKQKLWNNWKKTYDNSVELHYKKQANKARKLVRQAKREFESKNC